MLLKVPRATVMIGVRVTDDRVFDVGWIQTRLFHAADNLIFDGIIEDRVENDDSLRGRDRPHGVLGLAEEVKVVEHLHRFGMPRRSVRRPRLSLSAAGTLTGSLPTRRRSSSRCRAP